MNSFFHVEKRKAVLTDWAEKMVKKTEGLSIGWQVAGVNEHVYEVTDFKHGAIVDLRQGTCTCRYWQLNGLPCGHVIVVLSHLKKSNFGHFATEDYKMGTYRSTYVEAVFPLPEQRDWEVPDDLMVVYPPVMDTRQAGRPKNKNRIPSQGEERQPRHCSRCGSTTHNVARCGEILPMNPKKTRKSRAGTGSRSKGRGKNATGGTQGTQRTDFCSTFDLNEDIFI